MNTTSKNNSENKAAAQDAAAKKNNNNTSAAVASGVGAVAGAAAGIGAGVVIGSVISPDEVSASETVQHNFDADDNFFNLNNDDDVQPVEASRDVRMEPVQPIEATPEPSQPQEPVVTEAKVETVEQVEVVDQPEDEVQVMAYQRMTNPENGQTAEIAVVIEEGEEVGYIDSNIDGYADIKIQDANHDGDIDYSTETQDVSGQHIEMQPFQEAYEHQPDFNNNNDMADYVNNADVDNFMA